MRVLAFNHRPVDDRALRLGVSPASLSTLLATSDIVSLHCPLTPQTRYLINAKSLRRMKYGSILINTARGPLVDEAALADALRSGQVAAGGLDVFEHEPQIHPALLALDNVVLSPHMASAGDATRVAMAELAIDNVRRRLAGEPLLSPVI
jgi:lactate dehydrogenase-like 2-hydroxyacid dehydrogenase